MPKTRGNEKLTRIENQSLWQFSLRVYTQPDVERTCLTLQDKWGMDVNLILACCWAGLSGRGALTIAELNELEQAVRAWREQIIFALRRLRKQIKISPLHTEATKEIYEQVKLLELKSEEAEQLQLMQLLAPRRQNKNKPDQERYSDAFASLSAYARMPANRVTQPDETELRALLKGILAA